MKPFRGHRTRFLFSRPIFSPVAASGVSADPSLDPRTPKATTGRFSARGGSWLFRRKRRQTTNCRVGVRLTDPPRSVTIILSRSRRTVFPSRAGDPTEFRIHRGTLARGSQTARGRGSVLIVKGGGEARSPPSAYTSLRSEGAAGRHPPLASPSHWYVRLALLRGRACPFWPPRSCIPQKKF